MSPGNASDRLFFFAEIHPIYTINPYLFYTFAPQKKTTNMELFNKMIAAALKVSVHQVDNTLSLLGGGATIPFISRYRKEATGGLDEVQIGEIKDRNDKLCELAKRKETILSTIEEQGKLTEELRKRIEQSWDATEVEDIYLPYKPKRKTRAEAARQKDWNRLPPYCYCNAKTIWTAVSPLL